MGMNTDKISAFCNRIASNLPLVDISDLSPLGAILSDFEEICNTEDIPIGIRNMCSRAAALARLIIKGETDLVIGCKKIGECVCKIMNNIRIEEEKTGIGENEDFNCENIAIEDNENIVINNNNEEIQLSERLTVKVQDEIKEFLIKFANNQQAVLEDFEVFILDLERGNPQARDAIQRILHTWKGEFGVLDLHEYSSLIHQVEEKFQNDSMTIDGFFRLKDFLTSRIMFFAQGEIKLIKEEDIQFIFNLNYSNEKFHSQNPAPDKDIVKNEKEETNDLESEQKGMCCVFEGDPSMMGDFITESKDHLHTAESLLLELETDLTNIECVNGIFRVWHTIKGIAGFLGLKEVNHLAHSIEGIIDRVRKGELILNCCYIDLLLEANDCLKDFLQAIERAICGKEYEIPQKYPALLKKLACPMEHVKSHLEVPVKPEQKIGEILIENGLASKDVINNALVMQSEGDERKLGEILIDEGHLHSKTIAGVLADQNSARQAKNIEETIRVPVNRIDQIVDTIGEAVIAQSMIHSSASILNLNDQILHTKIAHANMIMRQIQEMAMSLRMLSIKSTFQKMARLARDLSKKFDRDIDFVTEGEDTELDKSVVENIGDPLIHMIRNSIDHGIEPSEERKKTGKPLKAIIKLSAYHRAGNIIIEVTDDGRGLDKEAIYSKALAKGICSKEEHLSDQEIYQFIFLPGFSTAKQVTDVSGRGVGMDVVKRNIDNLHGSIEVATSFGKGTTFSIRLPLTLAIVDGMIVRSGEELYIIPTLAVVESIKSSEEKIGSVIGEGKIVKVREELISVVHLASLFNKNGNGWNNNSGIIMIVEDMLGKKIGLYVDEILGQQQVVVKSLGNGIGDIPGITGGAIMSDGNVSLIIDIGGIVKMAGF